MLNIKETEIAARLMHSSSIDELMECMTDRSDLDDQAQPARRAVKPLEAYRPKKALEGKVHDSGEQAFDRAA